jgi:hypothetical protein
LEVKDLLDEIRSRYDSAIAIEIDLYDGQLQVIAREESGYPIYTLKEFGHYSDVNLLPPNRDDEDCF